MLYIICSPYRSQIFFFNFLDKIKVILSAARNYPFTNIRVKSTVTKNIYQQNTKTMKLAIHLIKGNVYQTYFLPSTLIIRYNMKP